MPEVGEDVRLYKKGGNFEQITEIHICIYTYYPRTGIIFQVYIVKGTRGVEPIYTVTSSTPKRPYLVPYFPLLLLLSATGSRNRFLIAPNIFLNVDPSQLI